MRLLSGCRKIALLTAFACIAIFILSLLGGQPTPDGLPTLAALPSLTWTLEARSVAALATQPPGVTIIPTVVVNRSGFVTITPVPGTSYPTATITDTPQPPPTNTVLPTKTSLVDEIIPVAGAQGDPNVMVIQPIPYYAEKQINVRACPRTDCERLGQVAAYTQLIVDAIVNGEEVETRNFIWYRVQYGNRQAFVYSGLMLAELPKPTVAQQPVIQQSAPPIAAPVSPITSNNCPDLGATCSQLTCEQAYACLTAGNGSLDRDHDGIPCESICGG